MNIVLSPEELYGVTGYHQATRQLVELHSQGFWRARLKDGRLILERAHYEAVCAGAQPERKIVSRVASIRAT